MNKQETYEFLNTNQVRFEITEHKALFTMADVPDVEIPYPEADAKNLFVRDDKKRNYYLITVRGDKRVDLKEFRRKYGTRSLSFASAEELMSFMKVTPGSVSPFGLFNDETASVIFYIDREFDGGLIGCHPNDNTATVWLRSEDLISLIRAHGNQVYFADL